MPAGVNFSILFLIHALPCVSDPYDMYMQQAPLLLGDPCTVLCISVDQPSLNL